MPFAGGRLAARFAAAPLLALLACDAPPAASTLPEWTPADHDHAEEAARAATQSPGAAGGGAPGARASTRGPDPLLEAAWSQQCAACHGPIGRGDGPTGPMVHATDLTRSDWQATVTDEQLAASITHGKGKMPPFPNLPPKLVQALIARIRASRGR